MSGGLRGSDRPVLVGRPVFWLWIGGTGFLVGVGRPVADEYQTFGVRRSSERCSLPQLESIWLVESSSIRHLVIVGHPEVVGRPRAAASWQLFLLYLALGVLAVFSNAPSCSMAFLLVPGHA